MLGSQFGPLAIKVVVVLLFLFVALLVLMIGVSFIVRGIRRIRGRTK